MIAFQTFVVILTLVGSAYFSGLETGVVSINRLRLRHLVRKRVRHADLLQDFLDRPDHLLGTALVGNNLCNVVASVTAVSLGVALLGVSGYTVSYVALTLMMLIFGEYLPKSWFQAHPARRVLPFARSLQLFGLVFYPASVVVTAIARVLVPVPSEEKGSLQPFITRDEVEHLTREGERTGSIKREEGRMLQRVLTLARQTCRDVMTPRDRMVQVDLDATADVVIELARSRNISRLPVYDRENERYVGIVYAFDIAADKQRSGDSVSDYMRPPQFISADTPPDEALGRMRLSRQPMALVTDGSGTVIGVVTTENVLERIVGPLGDDRRTR